jgi:hypothetical protein
LIPAEAEASIRTDSPGQNGPRSPPGGFVETAGVFGAQGSVFCSTAVAIS